MPDRQSSDSEMLRIALNARKTLKKPRKNKKSQGKTIKTNKILRKNFNIYGYNRLRIENFIRDNFDDYLIVRLPALFGWKLKKNFFFDILNSKSLKYYNKKTSFQWYFIEWIIKDLKYALKNKIKTINFQKKTYSKISRQLARQAL